MKRQQPWWFLSHQITRDGYGYGSLKMIEALQAAGATFEPVDMTDATERISVAGTRRWYVPGDALVVSTPDWLPYVVPATERSVCLTMFESTLMPADRVSYLNGFAEAVIVPCDWVRECFERQGVGVPIYVVPWGVDQGDYWLLDRKRDGSRPYRFLWSGTPDMRKGWDVAYRAFIAAFGQSRDAELVLHWRRQPEFFGKPLQVDDPNVKVLVGMHHRPVLRKVWQSADVFLFPSRGEGWGLPPREAAATGLPVIATNATGMAHDIEQWALPLRVARWKPAAFSGWPAGSIGEWAEPDVDHLVELMRWCYEHRDEAAALGQRAADWMAEYGGWDVTARGITGVMEC